MQATDLNRPVLIHVCKDGTISYRTKGQPVLNGVALPVFSVDTEAEAVNLQLRFCRKQYKPHPEQPDRPWYKLSRLGDGTDPALRPGGVLEYHDLPGIAEMFRVFHEDAQKKESV